MARKYKIFRKCKGCKKKFLVKHRLRLYCDDCRQKSSGKKKSKKKKSKKKKSKKKKK
ncbi:MAG: hypothetical protein MAG795_00536 [Candidatus Woesearchaeota archaeon]|nr:hypothetical protein [Candidatus Woesearchaeota archaeon]